MPYLNHFNEPDWMRKFRLEAFELFESIPMPTTKDEAWRRTDLRRFKLDNFAPAINGVMGDAGTMPAYLGEQLTEEVVGGTLLQIDGQSYKFELSDELKAQGIHLLRYARGGSRVSRFGAKIFHDEIGQALCRQICGNARRVLARRYIFVRAKMG